MTQYFSISTVPDLGALVDRELDVVGLPAEEGDPEADRGEFQLALNKAEVLCKHALGKSPLHFTIPL